MPMTDVASATGVLGKPSTSEARDGSAGREDGDFNCELIVHIVSGYILKPEKIPAGRTVTLRSYALMQKWQGSLVLKAILA